MKTLLKLVIFLLSTSCFAQVKSTVVDEDGRPTHYGVSASQSKIPVYLETDRNTRSISPFNQITNDPLGTLVYLDGATNVLVTTLLKKDSLSYYRYTVIENDTTIKVFNGLLTKVNFVWNKYSSHPGCLTMDLGISAVAGKKITVKIYRLPHPEEVTTVIIYNKILPVPVLTTAFLIAASDKATEKNPWLRVADTLKRGSSIHVTGKTIGIMLGRKKTDLDFVYNLFLKYNDGGTTAERMISNNWNYNVVDGDPLCLVDADQFRMPGNYTLIVRALTKSLDGKMVKYPEVSIPFTVLSPPKVYSEKDVLNIAGIIIIVAGIIFFFIRSRNKKIRMVLKRSADVAKSELGVVRTQLNPHFVFNALSGIQNLMNKNEVEKANEYLNKFAGLTRSVLDERDKISINEESKLITDYLSMEQLRFPFAFKVQADQSAGFDYVEIPAMLLQPFVENAVKHGVAGLKDKGNISVNLSKQGNDVVLEVADNGGGFDVNNKYSGLGLALSKKRIALLNEVYTECPVILEIKSAGNGTRVRMTLKNWL